MEGVEAVSEGCRCGTDAAWCPAHVSCDSDCRALEEPVSFDEIKAALDHWKNHSWVSGCAHGC